MLVLTRSPASHFIAKSDITLDTLNGVIKIRLLRITCGKAKIGILAPDSVGIVRTEILKLQGKSP